MTHKPSFIESIAEKLGIIEDLHPEAFEGLPRLTEPGDLTNYPPPDKWDDWTEYEAKSGLKRERRNYQIVPTSCFNCEAGCGLLSYIDKETMEVRKFEGNPYHPGSRGRNCAKGPATINQINDVDRILYPLKRDGERGSGKWKRVSWDEALDDIASKIREALKEDRRNEVVYHVGRPGHEGFMDRVLQSWGVDGHNSHTNICSAGARFGYAIWHGADRPSPDHANARFILLISAHLESGHYFNPHAQRIIEGLMNGAKMAVMDPRLSNTASMADYWMPTYPGSEAAVLLAMAKIILDEGLYNRDFLYNWVNWRESLKELNPSADVTFENFIEEMKKLYAEYTPEFAQKESGADPEMIVDVARKIGEAGSRFSTHNWRSAGSGNLGGWAVSRCLHFLNVLTGSVGTVGGTMPSAWNKFKPKGFSTPPAQKFWNTLHFPDEYPLAHYEMSFLLPHFLKEGRGKLAVYFTRVFNPVWTYPDGFVWMEALSDESKVGLSIALTPTWNETAYFSDYVLPMGHSSERHDLISYETHSGKWIGFRQPVLREARRKMGEEVEFTYEANPGEVWEEDEFWIELSWRIDPDGSLGVREHFNSPYRPGEKITIEEYYRFIFENTKGLPEKAAEEGLEPLEYMRKYGAFEVESSTYGVHLHELSGDVLEGAETISETGEIRKDGKVIGISIDGKPHQGFGTPSRRQEFFSQTLKDWGWPEYKTPTYIKSHIHRENLKDDEIVLVPTFRLPTLIHSRSGNAKWLAEIANRNPLWMHPEDAKKWGVKTNDLVRVTTDIGFFVNKAWVTEGMKPGVVACSHHLGRWRRPQDGSNNRWASNLVKIENDGKGGWKMRVEESIKRSKSDDPDTERIFWSDGGVHQNITFPVHPDPISGMHCWHQRVRVEKAHDDDQYGDVFVDTEKSMANYREWLKMARPAPGPGGLRRPLWLARPLRPVEEMFYLGSES
ncbi:MAG: formate dehydrogenase [Acidobacteria bacterium]|nr:MAG: formate dehydrogenase [Acidobacteriota bacterium]REK01825.1 MAG: formate dehydrogenase [Acidobacteriota bacterium]REK14781.1 MAG: formate dehydrogenase [Acidobacteriota bacterium]REK45496.1 MAG: formate dehydrogenase [Acidobacteriota bacterium]